MNDSLIFLAIFFIASLFHALSGFGFPLISTPLLFLVTLPKEAIILTILPTIFMNSISIFGVKKGFRVLKKYYLLGIFVMIGSFLGTKIIILYPSNIYKLFLAMVIVFYLLKDKLNLDFSSFIEKNESFALIYFGLVGGIIGGLVNVMLVVMAILVLELKLDKNSSIVVMNFSFLLSKIAQGFTFINNNEFGIYEIKQGIIAICVCIISILIANKFKHKIDDKIFQKILKTTLVIFAFLLTFQYFFS